MTYLRGQLPRDEGHARSSSPRDPSGCTSGRAQSFLPLRDPASPADSRHGQYLLTSARERLPKVPLASAAQSPIPTLLPPRLRPHFPALTPHTLHLRTSSDACPLPHGVIYLPELVILLHVHSTECTYKSRYLTLPGTFKALLESARCILAMVLKQTAKPGPPRFGQFSRELSLPYGQPWSKGCSGESGY